MSRKGQSITLSISEQDKVQLEALALEFGKTWGDRPNISRLVEAIARRQLVIAPNHNWAKERVDALNRARNALVDAGEIQMAVALAHLLLERSELTLPLRYELEQFIAQPVLPWRVEVERFIHRNQPFQLSYQDAAERVWTFTIRYAKIVVHEDRQYLDCWCEEAEQSRDLPQLKHNRCLRLDRIADVAVSPIKGEWREGLATIQVEMHLFGGLALAYRSKTSTDEVNEWLNEPPQARRVVRQISNSFWFIREVLRYGQECEIVSPDAMRDRIQQEVRAMYYRYHQTTEP